MSLSLEAGGSTNTRRGGGDGEDLGGSGRGGGGYHWTRVEVGMTSGGSMELTLEQLYLKLTDGTNGWILERLHLTKLDGRNYT